MKYLLLLFAFCIVSTDMYAQKSNLLIRGSNTLYPTCKKLSEAFSGKYRGWKIELSGEGTEDGITAIFMEKTDIAMISRFLSRIEKAGLENKGAHYSASVIAFDALAIIVNTENPVGTITREEIQKIYTGKISNWKQLGGKDQPIVCISRDSVSGTYEYFKAFVIDTNRMVEGTKYYHSSEDVIKEVAVNIGTIAFVGHAFLRPSVKALAVSYDQGKEYVLPEYKNVINHNYPIVRPLYLLYLAKNTYRVKPFIDFVFSEEGQNIIRRSGYIPLQ